MKILFFSDYFPPFNPGGAEWSTYHSAERLGQFGHDVFVLTPNYGCNFDKKKNRFFQLISYPFWKKLKPETNLLPLYYNHNFFYYLYSAFWIIKVAKRENIDVIHLQSRFSLPAFIIIKSLLTIPMVVTVRDSMVFCPSGLCLHQNQVKKEFVSFKHYWQTCSQEYIKKYLHPRNLYQHILIRLKMAYLYLDNLLKRYSLSFFDRVIFISISLKDLYLKARLVTPNQTKVIYNTYPLKQTVFNNKAIDKIRRKLNLNNKKIVLFVSRPTLGKGITDLISAAQLVVKKEKQVIFLFVGKHKIMPKADYYLSLPWISHDKIGKYYQLADIVVVPSRCYEGFGRVPLEAASFRKPVIVAKSGGLTEQVVDQRNGIIIPKGKPEKLAAALVFLLKNNKLRIKMGRAHQQFVKKKFHRDKITKKLINIYQNL